MNGSPLSNADILRRLQEFAPSEMEMQMFGSGYSLTPEESSAFLSASSKSERELIIARSMSQRVREMQVDRRALADLT